VLTNPAGLTNLGIQEVRADLGFGFLNPPRKANGFESDSELYLMPGGAIAFNVNDRLYVGMGMAGLSGMGVDFEDISPMPGTQAVVTTKQFYKIAPGFGYRVSDRLSLGAALNFDYQSLALSTPAMPGRPALSLPQNQVFGWGLTAGLTYRLTDRWQLGAAWVSEQEMSDFEWNTQTGRFEMQMNAPETLTVGLAFQPNPGLLIELDVKRIYFSDVLDRVELKGPSGTATLNFGWDDQTVYALGIQKAVGTRTTVRAGLNYGESPIGPADVVNNIGSLAVVEKHVSLGATRQLGQKVYGSLSYMHAFNNEVKSNTTPQQTIELEQNILNLQVTYKF
jgi:long-chain fatty acid transport protein